MILSDNDIREALSSGLLVIKPLSDDTVRENGVDLKVGSELLRFNHGQEVDLSIKASTEGIYSKEEIAEFFVLNPGERVLIKTNEEIKMPNDMVGFCNLRSTFARLGITIPPTIVDAGFEGFLTILMIGGGEKVKVPKGMRFLHLVFSTTKTPVGKAYAGKYQKSKDVAGAKL